jgi:hypothetical protein
VTRPGVARRALPGLLLVLCAAPATLDAAFVRANCRGIQQFSMTEGSASCREASVLDDGDSHLMLGHTRATASLVRGALFASAAGGQIRDVGANGGEAGALFMDRLTVSGDWDGTIAVSVRLCVEYGFAGFGESRVHATLRSSSANSSARGNQARVRLSHRGFAGTKLADFDSHGQFEIPSDGPRPAHSNLRLSVTESLQRSNPHLNVRVDIAAFALPNLDSLEPVLSSFSRVMAWIQVSLPPPLAFTSESGVFLSEPYSSGARNAGQGTKPSWVIIESAHNGTSYALRSHRRGHRAAARSDCRHQLGLDR